MEVEYWQSDQHVDEAAERQPMKVEMVREAKGNRRGCVPQLRSTDSCLAKAQAKRRPICFVNECQSEYDRVEAAPGSGSKCNRSRQNIRNPNSQCDGHRGHCG